MTLISSARLGPLFDISGAPYLDPYTACRPASPCRTANLGHPAVLLARILDPGITLCVGF